MKCRKTLNGAGLGFCNRRVNLFNLWFNNQRKDFLFFSVCLSGWMAFKRKLSGFLLAKSFLVGIPEWKQNSTDEINAKSCKVDFWLFFFFLSMKMFWYKCFPEAPKYRRLFTPSVLGASGGRFYHYRGEPLCKQPQTRLCFMCSLRNWLVRGTIKKQSDGWVS